MCFTLFYLLNCSYLNMQVSLRFSSPFHWGREGRGGLNEWLHGAWFLSRLKPQNMVEIFWFMCYFIVRVLFWLFYQVGNPFGFTMNSALKVFFLPPNLYLSPCLHCTNVLSLFWSIVRFNLSWQLRINLLIGCLSTLWNNFRAVCFPSLMFSVKN